jgi:GDPmannose 4,6-dehydratase
MWRILQQPKPDDYVIGTGESHTLKEFVRIAFEMVDLNWRDYVVIDQRLLRPSDLQSSYCNPEKALRQLNWKAHYKMKDVIKFMMADMLNPNI